MGKVYRWTPLRMAPPNASETLALEIMACHRCWLLALMNPVDPDTREVGRLMDLRKHESVVVSGPWHQWFERPCLPVHRPPEAYPTTSPLAPKADIGGGVSAFRH
jgi:hypothetical protein